MPSAIEYVPPTDIRRNDFNGATQRERQKRKERYETALQYYEGNHTPQVQADADDPEYDPSLDDASVNLAKMTADRTVSFLFPEIPEFQTDPQSIDDTPEEAWIKNELLPANGGLAMLTKLALRGFLAGHSFVWVKAAKPVPKIIVLQPMAVTVYWAADDVADVLWYEQRYIAQGRSYIRDFVKQKDGTWVIHEYASIAEEMTQAEKILDQITSQGNSDAWINLDGMRFGTTFKKEGKSIKHPSVIPPIIEIAHLPHPDDHYGQNEFSQKDLQDIINKMMAVRNRIVRENSDPVDVVDGDIDEIEDKGSIIAIPQGSKVTRLQLTTDLGAINDTINDLIEKYLAVARVVILKGEAKDLQRVTNAAVRTLFLDALAKNSVLRSAYGFGLELVIKLALLMAYGDNNPAITANPENLRVTIKYASPLPTDMTEVANQSAIAVNGKWMSRYSASIAQGLDPAFEQAKMTTEREEDMKQAEEDMTLRVKEAEATAATQPAAAPVKKI
jgi:hypothetical protein